MDDQPDMVEALEQAEHEEGSLYAQVSRAQIQKLCLAVLRDVPDTMTVGELRRRLEDARL